ncbi:MAG: pyruvate kinase [Candidatus Muiribacterium halophilum]|uniref:Pyruvate kinase n=1 Tax=Muiribacterium halophilum TaxID=2053465 RepID=A0A2N5ZL82_MUIH1|nr:MAG: pyruvate kinase [Candidatus Muirbacterium halophilum]
MRRTKILVTLGPATDNKEVLSEILDNGMNVARFNFSHGDHEEHKNRVELLREVAGEKNSNVALLMDTKGPEIRTRLFENGEIELKNDKQVTLTTEDVLGTEKLISVNYDRLPSMVKIGATILLDDGLVSLEVLNIIDKKKVLCKVINGGFIKDRRGVNIPNFHIDLPNPTNRDKEDVRFAVDMDYDFIAVSFVQSAETIMEYKKILRNYGNEKIQVIAKIENKTGVENFDSILNVADGIMVARGDLGVELPMEEVPIVQKELIKKCFMAGKPVITATQLLHSMIESPRPTRAEVSDVANAIYDLTSAVMLSGETSIGKFPSRCVDIMDNVSRRTEEAIDYRKVYIGLLSSFLKEKDMTNAVTNAALTTAYELCAKAIITVTETGYTARMLSKMRPKMPIIAVTSDTKVWRQLSINWGVKPVLGKEYLSLDELQEQIIKLSLETGLIENGDIVVIVAGVPVGIAGATNLIKVEIVGDVLVKGISTVPGKAKGRICLAKSYEELILNFKDGDIVVMKYLDEAVLPMLKQASGIIIEEEDVEGKIKLIGKTLGIPVISSARAALDILKNGMMIKMDAGEGQVSKI